MKLWGHQFSLEEWTDLSANRMASKGCDMLYGGLSMIEQSSLVIDQTLKLEEPKRLPRATPTVNHDDIAPRPRPPRPICSSPNIQQFLMPTELRNNTPLWPALRVDSEASMSTVLLNWAACLLSRPNQLVLLSFASRLRVPYLGLSDNKWLLGEFDPGQEDVFPSWYPLPWFVTSRLTNRFVKAEAMGGVDDGDHYDFRAPLSRQQRAIGFYHFIDSPVGETVDAFCKPQPWSKKSNFLRDMLRKSTVTDEQRVMEAGIRSEYEELKAATPTAPWPGTDTCDLPGEEAGRLRDRYRSAYQRAMKGRSIFATQQGRLTLAPCWAAERDVVSVFKSASSISFS
ncbi:hypothetical protein PG988_011367 [Apiospora saccharicola]